MQRFMRLLLLAMTDTGVIASRSDEAISDLVITNILSHLPSTHFLVPPNQCCAAPSC